MRVLHCYCDGGAKPNPGMMYGSFLVEIDPDHTIIHKFRFVEGTNNTAEYLALTELMYWLSLQANSGRLDSDTKVVIHMDSQLVIKQLSGENAVNADHLKGAHRRVGMFIDSLKNSPHNLVIEFAYFPEDEMKKKIGH